jgi:membrane protein DedA with SNARE-associated domain
LNIRRWLKLLVSKLEKLKQKVNEGNHWGIFIGRMTPVIRGYVSVVAGMLQIKPKIYMSIAFISAAIWSGGMVIAGYLLGPCWNKLAQKAGIIQLAGIIVFLIILMIIAGKYIVRNQLNRNGKKNLLIL